MAWKLITTSDERLNEENPDWKTSLVCKYGETIYTTYDDHYLLWKEYSLPYPMIISWYTNGKKILCHHHYYEEFPNALLFAVVSHGSYGNSQPVQRQRMKEAFAYADKHGYDLAIKRYWH